MTTTAPTHFITYKNPSDKQADAHGFIKNGKLCRSSNGSEINSISTPISRITLINPELAIAECNNDILKLVEFHESVLMNMGLIKGSRFVEFSPVYLEELADKTKQALSNLKLDALAMNKSDSDIRSSLADILTSVSEKYDQTVIYLSQQLANEL